MGPVHRRGTRWGESSTGRPLSRWLGDARTSAARRNPYGPEVSHEIQMAYYGRIVTQGNLGSGYKIVDEQRFAYPSIVVFLMAPTMYASFAEYNAGLRQFCLVGCSQRADVFWISCIGACRWQNLAAHHSVHSSSPQIVQGLLHQQ